MINVLIITSHFPPQLSAGANRPFSLLKYLPLYNIRPFVITKKFNTDLTKTEGVIYSESFINWRDSKVFSHKRLSRYLLFLFDKFLDIYPDKLWIKSAIEDAEGVIHNYKIDLIYATFPGAEALKIGKELSLRYSIPLISEFRDGLVFESVLRNLNFIQKKVALHLEKEVIKHSSAVITIAKAISSYFQQRYPIIDVYTVFNGYDEDDFVGVTNNFNGNSTSHLIYHFGNLNSSRLGNRNGLFEALSFLKKTGEISSEKLKIIFIGIFTEHERSLIIKYNLGDIVAFIGQMPKYEGIVKIMNDGTGLLFYGIEHETSIISSKLPEYLRMQIPILGICQGNEAEKIIQETKTGLVCGFETESIINMLRNFINYNYDFRPDIKKIKMYDRKTQTQTIANIINEVIDNEKR